LFEVDAMKVVVGSTPDPEVAALPKRRQLSAAYKCARPNPAKCQAKSVRYCARKECTAPTSRTGARRSRPANRPRLPHVD
jgi:hypothetical protein